MDKPTPENDALPNVANLTISSLSPDPEKSTLYPKISGKVEEVIYAYKFRKGIIDPITQEYLPGPPDTPLIEFTGTVKLHGTHVDLVIDPDDTMRVQSRNRTSLDIERDNYDCARSLLPKKIKALNLRDKIVARWKQLNHGVKLRRDCPVIMAGEWIGPGVQRSVAIEKLLTRAFVILSISVNDEWVAAELYKNIRDEEAGIYNISRGGFYSATLDVENPELCMGEMNTLTLQVEAECPFGKSFGLSGVGEGIVWRPVRDDLRSDPRLWLKTKGPLHRISNKPPKIDNKTEAREKARLFAESVITEMRLQQAWDYMGEMGIKRDKSGTPKFCSWLVGDVELEEKLEIEKLGVEKVILKKAIGDIGKAWYFEKLWV